MKQPGTKASWKEIKTGLIKALPEWGDEAPYQVRSISVKEACTAVSNAKKAYKSSGKFNTVKYRCKKDNKQSVYIPKSAIDDTGFFKLRLGAMRYAETLPDIEYDCRLVYDHGRWFVSIPYVKTVDIPITKEPMVALDPGVRTFQTYFGFAETGSIGDNAWNTVLSVCVQLDRLKSQIAKAKGNKNKSRKQNLRRAYNRLSHRLSNLQDELHWKTAVWLCKNYHVIAIPEFSAGEMSKKKERILKSKTVRSMLTLGHSKFRERLIAVAELYRSQVAVINEAYTSKTCTNCGHIHEKLGGAKTYKCPVCNTAVSRDINGARNIFLRAMLDQTVSKY